MIRRFILFFALILSQFLSAQSSSKAELFFNNRQYSQARSIYEALLRKRPNDPLYNYRMARCCYELKDYESAVKHFELSGNRYPLKDLYLGELYFLTYRYDSSVEAYQAFLTTLAPNDPKTDELNTKIKKAETGAKLMKRVQDIAIIDSVLVNKSEFLKYYKLNSELGTVSQQRLKLSKSSVQDKITFTTQRGDRVCYSDSLHGNMDIFSSFKLLNGWSAPVTISAKINSKANENYPFLMLDGITLYFASDGENSLGGYDLFITKYNPDTKDFLIPENIGFPFNSTANDYMMAIDEQRREGWFATDRNQTANKVMIYKFVPTENKKLFKTENNDSLRLAAQLRIYRKADKKTVANQSVLPEPVAPKQKAEFRVVINDSTVYTSPGQFKNVKVIATITEWEKLVRETETLKINLDKLRSVYDIETNTNKKEEIAQQILQSEKQLLSTTQKSNELLTTAVNSEITYLRNLRH